MVTRIKERAEVPQRQDTATPDQDSKWSEDGVGAHIMGRGSVGRERWGGAGSTGGGRMGKAWDRVSQGHPPFLHLPGRCVLQKKKHGKEHGSWGVAGGTAYLRDVG